MRNVLRSGLLPLLFLGAACSSDSDGSRDDVGGNDVLGQDVGDIGGEGATARNLIESVARTTSERILAFDTASDALVAATDAYAADLTDANREAAQDAWAEAMAIWQVAEMMQIGPAARMADSAGGEGLRDEVFSWPIDNPCRVDQELVEAGYNDDGFSSLPPSVRGLDAIEYLLFVETDDNACSATSGINADGEWAALGAEEVRQRRGTYASVAAALVADAADALAAAWQPDTGSYYVELVSAGNGSSLFATERDALNAISNAMFYLDKETKDMKLARPAGLSGCAEATCPDEVESLFARVSVDNIAANLEGFSQWYHGGPADGPEVGFHEVLIAMDAGQLADDMAAAIANAVALANDDSGSLFDRVSSDLDGVIALYDAVKVITDLLKTQFVGVLDLELPQRAAGDND